MSSFSVVFENVMLSAGELHAAAEKIRNFTS